MLKLVSILQEDVQSHQIFCDMDGVLTDFEGEFQKITGKTSKDVAQSSTQQEFWSHIDAAGITFWSHMQWMPGGKILWEYIKVYNPVILSAPTREESSRVGKRIWVQRELPGEKLILKPAYEKKLFASPVSILIDDYQKNIEEWESAGGIGIKHISAPNTIKQLKQLGL